VSYLLRYEALVISTDVSEEYVVASTLMVVEINQSRALREADGK
jgi:hypothetical protein